MKWISSSMVFVCLMGMAMSSAMAAPVEAGNSSDRLIDGYGPSLFPKSQALSDQALEGVQAQGLAFGILGMVGGGLAGLASYTVGQIVGAYHGKDWSWNMTDAQAAIYHGETEGAIMGLFSPEP